VIDGVICALCVRVVCFSVGEMSAFPVREVLDDSGGLSIMRSLLDIENDNDRDKGGP